MCEICFGTYLQLLQFFFVFVFFECICFQRTIHDVITAPFCGHQHQKTGSCDALIIAKGLRQLSQKRSEEIGETVKGAHGQRKKNSTNEGRLGACGFAVMDGRSHTFPGCRLELGKARPGGIEGNEWWWRLATRSAHTGRRANTSPQILLHAFWRRIFNRK